ncbi:hypothetical protein HaLaN_31041, partial [Haematococcus lacustris]
MEMRTWRPHSLLQAEQAEAQAAAQRDKDHAGATRLEAEVGALRQRLAEAEHSLGEAYQGAKSLPLTAIP